MSKELQAEDRTGKAIQSLTEEMDAIKRLLILMLLKAGASQTELAKALNVGQATISRFGIGTVTRLEVEVVNDGEDND